MTRTPAFELDSVLEAALTLFWESGYDATSLKQLEQATGLLPGSIYNSFGSKKALFVRVIEYYIDSVVTDRVNAMTNHPQPLVGIRRFFTTAFEDVPVANLHGCLLTNTATELCIEDKEIRNAVRTGVKKIESAFLSNLNRAIKNRKLPDDTDVNALAVHLTSCFQGLEVMARLNKNKKQLRLLSDMALSCVPE